MGFDPTVFSHGTAKEFDEFDPAFIGTGLDAAKETKVQGFFFTPSRRWAEEVADKVMDVHLRLGKSKVVDFGGEVFDTARMQEEVERAKSEGFNSVVFRNMWDDFDEAVPHKFRPVPQVVVWEPERIRSTSAKFDPTQMHSSKLLASVGGLGIAYVLTDEALAAEGEQDMPTSVAERARQLAEGDPDDLANSYLMRRRQALGAEAIQRAQRLLGSGQQPEAQPEAQPERVGEEEEGGGALSTAGAVAADVGKGMLELPVQALGGVLEAVQETANAVTSLAGIEELPVPDVREAETVTGDVGRKVAQFLTGFIPAMRVTKGLVAIGKAGRAIRPMLAGALADMAVFDPQEERLSNLVEEVPALQNPVTEFLAASPDDTEAEGRLKNALEGLALGGMTDAFVGSLRAMRGARRTGSAVQQAGAAGSRVRNMVFEGWINGLLSSPTTHAVNTLSNSIVALWQVPERLLAVGIRKATGGQGVELGEATAQIFGLVQGAKDGLRLAGHVARTGKGPPGAIFKLEEIDPQITAANLGLAQGGTTARAVDFIGGLVRVPGRALMTEDAFFKGVGYRMELNALAWRMAVQEGHTGPALAARMQQIIAQPPPHLQVAAIDAANYQTFSRELGEGGRKMIEGADKIPGMRVILPFIRTPVNIVKFVGERTPLAPLSRSVRAEIAAGGARRDLALARISAGSLIMAVTAELSAQGRITGGGPTDPAMRQALMRTGWQPYSLKVGDTYYSFNRLDPLGMMLGISADIAEIMGQVDEADAEALAAAAVLAVSNNLVSKTYLQGVADIVEIFASPGAELGASQAQRVLQSYVGTLIPAGVASVARLMDPTSRLVDSAVQEVRSRVPGYREGLPPRRNLWGEPIVLQGGLGPDIMSPIYTNREKGSPIDEEIVRNEVALKMPSRVLGGVELTQHEHDALVRLAGNELKDPSTGLGAFDTLNAIVTGNHPLSGAYANATDGPEGGKALIIRQTVGAFRELARLQVQRDIPELGAAVAAKRAEGVQALTGEPLE